MTKEVYRNTCQQNVLGQGRHDSPEIMPTIGCMNARQMVFQRKEIYVPIPGPPETLYGGQSPVQMIFAVLKKSFHFL